MDVYVNHIVLPYHNKTLPLTTEPVGDLLLIQSLAALYQKLDAVSIRFLIFSLSCQLGWQRHTAGDYLRPTVAHLLRLTPKIVQDAIQQHIQSLPPSITYTRLS